MINYKQIGEVSNYYGALYAGESDNRYYWVIENYSTDMGDVSCWYEIDQELYDALIAYESRRPK